MRVTVHTFEFPPFSPPYPRPTPFSTEWSLDVCLTHAYIFVIPQPSKSWAGEGRAMSRARRLPAAFPPVDSPGSTIDSDGGEEPAPPRLLMARRPFGEGTLLGLPALKSPDAGWLGRWVPVAHPPAPEAPVKATPRTAVVINPTGAEGFIRLITPFTDPRASAGVRRHSPSPSQRWPHGRLRPASAEQRMHALLAQSKQPPPLVQAWLRSVGGTG